jgi:hypothetical protein
VARGKEKERPEFSRERKGKKGGRLQGKEKEKSGFCERPGICEEEC